MISIAGGPCIWKHRIQAHSTAGAPTAEHGGEINTVGQSVAIQVTASGSPSRQHEREISTIAQTVVVEITKAYRAVAAVVRDAHAAEVRDDAASVHADLRSIR